MSMMSSCDDVEQNLTLNTCLQRIAHIRYQNVTRPSARINQKEVEITIVQHTA